MASGQFQIDINHAASIQFGKLVEFHWKWKTKEQADKIITKGYNAILLDPSDKQFVIDNIMEAIHTQVDNRQIQKQFVRSLKGICIHDFPASCPNMLAQIMALIKGDTPKKVYAGLQGLISIIARYEYEMEDERQPLHEIVANVFP